MLVAFVNFLCILPATALQFFYQSKAVTMKHPRCYVATATAVSTAIWAVNNFLCSPPSAVLDTVQLFQCYVLAWLFAKRREKDCLVISCRNAAAAPEKKDRSDPLRSHGLGLGILSRLAESYGGSFQTSCENGAFSAVLILRFSENRQ